jgi:hypothetical protein
MRLPARQATSQPQATLSTRTAQHSDLGCGNSGRLQAREPPGKLQLCVRFAIELQRRGSEALVHGPGRRLAWRRRRRTVLFAALPPAPLAALLVRLRRSGLWLRRRARSNCSAVPACVLWGTFLVATLLKPLPAKHKVCLGLCIVTRGRPPCPRHGHTSRGVLGMSDYIYTSLLCYACVRSATARAGRSQQGNSKGRVPCQVPQTFQRLVNSRQALAVSQNTLCSTQYSLEAWRMLVINILRIPRFRPSGVCSNKTHSEAVQTLLPLGAHHTPALCGGLAGGMQYGSRGSAAGSKQKMGCSSMMSRRILANSSSV